MQNIKFAGIHFLKDDESGVARINVRNITKGIDVILGEMVDLFSKQFDYTAGAYEDFIWWVKLSPASDQYTIQAFHNGNHNPEAVGSEFHILIKQYLLQEELYDPEIQAQVKLWHTDYEIDSYLVDLDPDADVQNLYVPVYFSGDNVTKTFTLPSTYHAAHFLEFSIDGGLTWRKPNDQTISWGINAPNFDDNQMNSAYGFTVNFDIAPSSGTNNIIIRIIPRSNKMKIIRKMKLPYRDEFIDRTSITRLLTDSLEVR